MNIQEFGKSVKQKYPQYNSLPDDVLGNMMLSKYPQYKSMVTGGTPSIDEQLKDVQLQRNKLALQEEQANSIPSKGVSSYISPIPTKTIIGTQAQRPSLSTAFEDVPDTTVKQTIKSQTLPTISTKETKKPEKTLLQKGGDILYGAAKFLVPKTVSQYETALSNFNPKLTKERKIENLKKVQEGQLKAGLELGSYLIPAGKGITGMAKMGAVMGGMRGASEGEGALPDIGSTVKGAAGGALGGALIGASSKAIKGLVKNVPERIMNSLFREPIKATKAALGKGATLGKEALQKRRDWRS